MLFISTSFSTWSQSKNHHFENWDWPVQPVELPTNGLSDSVRGIGLFKVRPALNRLSRWSRTNQSTVGWPKFWWALAQHPSLQAHHIILANPLRFSEYGKKVLGIYTTFETVSFWYGELWLSKWLRDHSTTYLHY